MTVGESAYNFFSKSFKYELVRKIKRKLRPLKWYLFGKEGIYEAVDMVNGLERKKGKEVRVVFDIGAADGEYSLSFCHAFPQARVYSFEPQSRSFAKLEKRTAFCRDRVKPFKIGFYNANEQKIFHLMSYPDSSSLLPNVSPDQAEVGTETVSLKKLDDFVEENGISHIDFMKIDVESVEKEVIEGGIETLKNKTDNLFIEVAISRAGVYSSNYIDVLKLLHGAGFMLVKIMSMGDASDFFFSKLS